MGKALPLSEVISVVSLQRKVCVVVVLSKDHVDMSVWSLPFARLGRAGKRRKSSEAPVLLRLPVSELYFVSFMHHIT